jgi:hypothetical protein
MFFGIIRFASVYGFSGVLMFSLLCSLMLGTVYSPLIYKGGVYHHSAIAPNRIFLLVSFSGNFSSLWKRS